MKGHEIRGELEKKRVPIQSFIRWWRKEESSPNYELVQDFLSNVNPEEEFSGYELLDLAQMLEILEKVAEGRISRESRTSGEFLLWTHHSGAGEMVVEECLVSPESVMTIYDIETNPRLGHSFGSPEQETKHPL